MNFFCSFLTSLFTSKYPTRAALFESLAKLTDRIVFFHMQGETEGRTHAPEEKARLSLSLLDDANRHAGVEKGLRAQIVVVHIERDVVRS
jgi:hypothetical protein